MLALFCKPVVVIEPPKNPIITPQDCRIVQVREIKGNDVHATFLEPLDWYQAPPVIIEDESGRE
jgi:hypothetical protein